MGEYVWTVMSVGGAAKRATLKALKAASEHYAFVEGDIDDALENKSPVHFAGELNFGNAEDLEEFCQKHGLPYVLSWAAQPGQFHSGLHYWRPGMETSAELSADDDGNPVIGVACLQKAAKDGKNIENVIASLEPAMAKTLPPLELIASLDDASQA